MMGRDNAQVASRRIYEFRFTFALFCVWYCRHYQCPISQFGGFRGDSNDIVIGIGSDGGIFNTILPVYPGFWEVISGFNSARKADFNHQYRLFKI